MSDPAQPRSTLRILAVHCDPGSADRVSGAIGAPESGFALRTTLLTSDGLALLRSEHFDALLADLALGLGTIDQLRRAAGSLPLIALGRPHDPCPPPPADDILTLDQIGLALLPRVIRHAVQLRHAERALEAERATLDARVATRTAELQLTCDELTRAVRLKDEFLASMSHELRTPLNAILGRSELLQEGVYGQLDSAQIDALHGIDASSRHLLALINDILDLSKIEAGKLELHVEPIDVDLVCRMSLHMVAESALRKGISLRSSLGTPDITMMADERRLKQILVNLLSNAVKFTPEGGRAGLDVTADDVRREVTFTVWDTGIGIAAEHLPRLFRPFTQIDSGLSRLTVGSGLGLSLVHRLVQAHGGSVAVESLPGAGSRFSATIPWNERSAHEAPAAARTSLPPLRWQPAPWDSRRPPAAPPVVLLADDNAESQQVTADYLAAHGYAVAVAGNGRDALTLARAGKPAAVLMDIQMPGLDGIQTTHLMRADSLLHDVPIIALTALAMPGDRERCLAAGADAYLTKPVSMAELVRVLRGLIHERGATARAAAT